MSEYLRLKEIVEQTFKMEFVSDDQRKAVFAALADSSGDNKSSKKRNENDDSGDKPYGFGNSIDGAGWYHTDMSDNAFINMLINNDFQEGEIEAHQHFANRIKRLGLKKIPIEHSLEQGRKVTRFTYVRK